MTKKLPFSPQVVRALERIKWDEPAFVRVRSQAQWLIDFSTENLSTSTAKLKTLQLEAMAFAYVDDFSCTKQGQFLKRWPSRDELRSLQSWLLMLFEDLKNGKYVMVHASSWAASLCVQDNRLSGMFELWDVPWTQAFKIMTWTVLTHAAVTARFRFCSNEKCRAPFLANKRQAYCSPTCSQAHRTQTYRRRNPERFRELRRAAYERKMKAQVGMNVRINKRKECSP